MNEVHEGERLEVVETVEAGGAKDDPTGNLVMGFGVLVVCGAMALGINAGFTGYANEMATREVQASVTQTVDAINEELYDSANSVAVTEDLLEDLIVTPAVEGIEVTVDKVGPEEWVAVGTRMSSDGTPEYRYLYNSSNSSYTEEFYW